MAVFRSPVSLSICYTFSVCTTEWREAARGQTVPTATPTIIHVSDILLIPHTFHCRCEPFQWRCEKNGRTQSVYMFGCEVFHCIWNRVLIFIIFIVKKYSTACTLNCNTSFKAVWISISYQTESSIHLPTPPRFFSLFQLFSFRFTALQVSLL